jgi:hypothetical protein
VNFDGGIVAGKAATILVGDDEKVARATLPTVTLGLTPKPLPAMVSVAAV